MKEDSRQKPGRKTYEKPRLRTIELAAEEVLAVGCKTISSGIAPGAVSPPCMIRNCSGRGS